MILSLKDTIHNGIKFASSSQKNDKKEPFDRDTLLKNNILTNFRISSDKFLNACTIYPAKGITGNKNSNFYEFLTMGTVPYIIGSVMLMSVFNSANKHFDAFSKSNASKFGKKMALGVLFYGIAKELSKPLITQPVKLATGVDVDLPYAKVNYELPDFKDDTDITSIEYHKVFESVEFPRWDLLYGDETKGQKRNYYYDRVAKKLGLGSNLKDSDQEVKPRIKEIATKAIAAKNIVPYLWAGVGVGMAFQSCWDNFFGIATAKFWHGRKFFKTIKSFGNNLVESAKELYTGGIKPTKGAKIGGKALIFTAFIATILADLNIIYSNKKPAVKTASAVIQKDRKYIIN